VIKANSNIESMAAYALPDISTPEGVPPIILAQNEHVYPPSLKVQQAIAAAVVDGNLYPDADWCALRAVIAKEHSIDPDRILCGSGSMELMLFLSLAYLSAKDRILISEYGYLFMRTLAKMTAATIDIAAEPDYRVDVDLMLAQVRDDTRLVFVVNPGNPTGTVIANDDIRRLRAALDDDIILLIDEAYAEYVDPAFNTPLFDLVEQGNTVITRTFSKIYGLAGMRVGWGYFPDAIRDNMRKMLNPNNVSLLSQVAAQTAMEDHAAMLDAHRQIAEQRDVLSMGLAELGIKAIPSQTSFVLADFEDPQHADSAFKFLRAAGIVVRPMGGYGLPGCLRITVGKAEHMQQTIATLKQWQEQ
jgi:histidinol-phosphate aminotransferase